MKIYDATRGRDEKPKLDLDPEEKFNRKYIITCI